MTPHWRSTSTGTRYVVSVHGSGLALVLAFGKLGIALGGDHGRMRDFGKKDHGLRREEGNSEWKPISYLSASEPSALALLSSSLP
jgi:hypothetical protein